MRPIEVGVIGASPGSGWAAAEWDVQATDLRLAGGQGSDVRVHPVAVPELRSGAGLTGPARNVASLYAGFARDLEDGTTEAPSFPDAARLYRPLDRIAGGAAVVGATMQADSEEHSCALQS